MFETSEERVKWLKNKRCVIDMEQLYIETNSMKVIRGNLLSDEARMKTE